MKKSLLLILPLVFLGACAESKLPDGSTSAESSDKQQNKHSLGFVNENGSVLFKVGGEIVSEAKEGDLIDVYLTFNEGYRFKEFANKEIAFTEVKKGEVYSFSMPNSDITITVKSEAKKVLNLTEVKAYSSHIIDIDGLTQKTFYEGDEVEFSFKGLEGKKYKFFVNGSEFDIEEADGKFHGTFAVPSVDFKIEIFEYYIPSSTGVRVTFNADDLNYKVYGIENEATYQFDGDMTFYIIGNYGVKISGNYLFDGASGLPLSIQDDGLVTIPVKEDAKSVTINIEASQVGAGNITFKEDDLDKLKIETSKTTNVFYGDFVSIKATGETGYKPISATVTDGEEKEIASVFIANDGLLTFTMPQSSVLIDFEIATPKTLSFTASDALKTGEFLVNSLTTTSAFPTDEVEFVPTLNEGFLTSDATFFYQEGKELTKRKDSLGETRFFFTVPSEGEVNVTCQADRYYSVTFKGEADTFSVSDKDAIFKAGEKASFAIKANEGYQIDSVSITGVEVSLEDGKYVFTMPAHDVEIVVKTSEVKTVSLVFKKGTGVSSFEARDEKNNKIYDYGAVTVGSKVTLSFGFENGYEFKSLTSNNTNVAFKKESDTSYSFIVIEMEETLTLTLEGQKIVYPAINLVDSSKLFTSFDLSSSTTGRKNNVTFPFEEVPTGEKVTIYANAKKDTVDTSTFKVESSLKDTTITVIGDQGYSDVQMAFSFVMPNSPISLTLSIDKKAVEEENTNPLALSMDQYQLEYNFDGSDQYVQTDGKFSLGKTIYLHSLLTEEQFTGNSMVKSGYYFFGFQFVRADWQGKAQQVGKLVKITSYNQVSSVELGYTYYSFSSKEPLTVKIDVFENSKFK